MKIIKLTRVILVSIFLLSFCTTGMALDLPVNPVLEPKSTVVNIGQAIEGQLNTPSEQDVYKFSVEPGRLIIHVTPTSNMQTDLGLFLNNSPFGLRSSAQSPGDPIDYFIEPDQESIIYLTISDVKGVISNGDYKVETSFIPKTLDSEPNNEFQLASEVRPNGIIEGQLSSKDDIDCYKLNVSENGKLEFNFGSYSGNNKNNDVTNTDDTNIDLNNNSRADFIVYDSNENLLGINRQSQIFKAGLYFIKLIPGNYENNPIDYRADFKFTPSTSYIDNEKDNIFENEPNNDINSPSFATPNSNIRGGNNSNGDVDYYNFSLAEDGKLNLDLKGLDPDSTVQITNQDGKPIFTYNKNPLDWFNTIDTKLSKGNYFLKISNIKSYYNINLTFKPFSLDTTNPTLSNVKFLPNELFVLGKDKNISITFNISEDSTNSIKVKDYKNKVIRHIAKEMLSGKNTILWDGKNDNGLFVNPRQYIIEIQATDYNNNHSNVIIKKVTIKRILPINKKGKVKNKTFLLSSSNSKSKKIKALSKGLIVKVIEQDGNWYKINYKNSIGYIYSKDITLYK